MIPSSSMRIRRMTAADLDCVLEIVGEQPNAPHWPRSAYLAALEPNAAPNRIALVAEVPGPSLVAAFAIASLLPPQAELELISVDSARQRQGLAKFIFAALAAELRAAKITQLALEVRASNQPALGLYRRLGFAESGRRSRYYHDPVEDAILMRLGL
jgi:ribosomal-protein-alanine N-acetyltransferase